MLVTEEEVIELKNFIFQLNSMKDSVVVVEGKRDSIALKKLGFTNVRVYLGSWGEWGNKLDLPVEK